MSFTRAGQLARETPVARPGDALGLVAENLRESQYDAIPVIEGEYDEKGKLKPNARVIGIVFEYDLAAAVLPILELRESARVGAAAVAAGGSEAGGNGGAGAPPLPDPIEAAGYNGNLNGGANGYVRLNGQATAATGAIAEGGAGLGEVENLRARDIMHEFVAVVPDTFSLHNALLTLERYNAPALPVVDGSGGYRGMVSRSDVVAALGSAVRPPSVGGIMATPLGVWLTTGHLSGGAPPLGLFLTGLSLGLMKVGSHLIMLFCLAAINSDWAVMFLTNRIGLDTDSSLGINIFMAGAEGLLFLLLMRITPLAGIHAAEHQTVWAIERGLPLEPEYVKKMPRAHPRCGTNLMALAGLILIVMGHLPDYSGGTILVALLFIYLFWRNFGTALQQYLTTRPASPRQLESGIRAGKQVLAKYQGRPHLEISFGQRIFNSGLVLAALGMLVVIYAAQWAMSLWAFRLVFG